MCLVRQLEAFPERFMRRMFITVSYSAFFGLFCVSLLNEHIELLFACF